MNHGNSEVKDEWNHQRKRPKQELCLGLGKPWANVSKVSLPKESVSKDETLLMRSVRKFHITIYLDQTSLSKIWASLHRGLSKPVNQELDTTLIKPPKKTLDTSEQPPRNFKPMGLCPETPQQTYSSACANFKRLHFLGKWAPP